MSKEMWLLVDDDIENLDCMSLYLQEEFPDVEINAKNNSVEALADLISIKNYQVVITDFRMPKVSGKEIIHNALQLNIKNILLTSGEMPEELKQDFMLHKNLLFFAKPIVFEQLIETLKNRKL